MSKSCGFAAEQAIAHAAADPERGEARRLQAADDVGGDGAQGRVPWREIEQQSNQVTKEE